MDLRSSLDPMKAPRSPQDLFDAVSQQQMAVSFSIQELMNELQKQIAKPLPESALGGGSSVDINDIIGNGSLGLAGYPFSYFSHFPFSWN